jgi:hypothetical protein
MALSAHSGPRPLIQFRNHFYTDGRTPWTSDQPVARPLHKHKTTQTPYKRIHTPNINALSGIRTHDPSARASEDILCLKPRGNSDRPDVAYIIRNQFTFFLNNKTTKTLVYHNQTNFIKQPLLLYLGHAVA